MFYGGCFFYIRGDGRVWNNGIVFFDDGGNNRILDRVVQGNLFIID